jgi:tRNA (guanine-N7-)-methyltransferase
MLPEDVDLDLDACAIPLDWPALFGRTAPVQVEIGSGKGRFLNALAEAHPERDLLAVERAAKYHRLECRRAARRGLANIRVVRTTAEDLLLRLLAPASVEAIYVLFPDPWPKKRHHKRRLITVPTVLAMARALTPGGRLLIKTDHAGYAEVIDEVLARVVAGEVSEPVPHADPEPGPTDRPPVLRRLDPAAAFDGLPLSGFEVKYQAECRPIASFALERAPEVRPA